MAVYSLTLPNTPPTKEAKNPYAFLEALKLMASRNFAVLLIISFIVGIELPFYYNLTNLFLTDPVKTGAIGLAPSMGQFAQSLGQVGEVLLMVLLWPSIRYLGMRTTIFLGILAWPVRYAIFAIGHPVWLVIAAQTLHGICYSFFFVGGMIAVERLAHKDIRASAQSLMVFATNGVGMLIGHIASGQVHDHFRTPKVWVVVDGAWKHLDGHNWSHIFMVPIAITVVAGVAFWLLFDERKFREETAQVEQEDQAQAPHEIATGEPE